MTNAQAASHPTLTFATGRGAAIVGQPAVAAGRPPLDSMRIAKEAAIITALLLVNLGGNYGAGVFFFILALMALRGPEPAFKAMAICFLGLLLNTSFVPKSIVWTPGRLGLPFLVLLRYGLHVITNPRLLLGRPYYLTLLIFCATMAMCSIESGWYTQIALFKLINFTVFLTSVFLLVGLINDRRRDLSEWFVGMIVVATGFGVLSVITGAGWNFALTRGAEAITADSFFNGAFLHPNVHALYASLMFSFLCCVYLLSPYRNRWITPVLAAIWVWFMLYSRSRTSIFASLVPLVVLIGLAGPSEIRSGRQLRANMNRSTLVLIVAALVAVAGVVDLASGGVVSKSVISFLHKWDTSENESLDTEKMLGSRQGLIDFAWQNFQDNFWTGIGFQVAKTDVFVNSATYFTAPTEKGFLPVAVLEEGGVFGATAFTLFLLTLVGTWYREKNIPAIVAFTGFLTSNMGEATMLSPGGGGAFGWVMVGAAAILGNHCWRPARATSAGSRWRRPHAAAFQPAGAAWTSPQGSAVPAGCASVRPTGGAAPNAG